MTYRIQLGPCINCGMCRLACPTDTIRYYATGHRTHVVIDSGCIDCGICAQICPMDCVDSIPEIVPSPQQLEAARAKARDRARLNRANITDIDDRIRKFIGTSAGASDLLAPQYLESGGGS